MKHFLPMILLTISANAMAAEVIIPFGKNNLTGPLLKYKIESTIPDASADGSWVTGARYSTLYLMNPVFKVNPNVYPGNFQLNIKAGNVSHTIQLSKGTSVLKRVNSKGQTISTKIMAD